MVDWRGSACRIPSESLEDSIIRSGFGLAFRTAKTVGDQSWLSIMQVKIKGVPNSRRFTRIIFFDAILL